jgi:NAD(P)-dependent dehydrogenase (short-subunit alcohol dehydrogenase family)
MSGTGRVALVTGGTGTVGTAVCHRLADAGMHIAVHYHTSRDKAESLLGKLRASGLSVIAVQADLRSRVAVAAMFDQVHAALGLVDVLVNTVGAAVDTNLVTTTPDAWDATLAINLTSQFECMRLAALDMLRSGWGRIVNVGSAGELIAWHGQGPYVAAKAGLTGLSRVAARELARHGVTVNVVAPGLVSSSAAEHALSDRQRAGILTRSPSGRPVSPDAVAAAIAFFCSDEAAAVTGQVLAVDGGMSI